MTEEVTFDQQRPELRICGHCRERMRGYASLGDTWLCHPDEGMDCYRLVTVSKHPMRCTDCDPLLKLTSTWHEVFARMAQDWTPQQWAAWDEELANPGAKDRRINRSRRLWRRKGRGKR